MNSEEKEIIKLSEQIVKIELAKDAESLEKYISDEYIGIDPSGALITKEISINRYRNADFNLSEHGISNITVSIVNETAIEIGIMTLKGNLGSFEFGGRYRYLHIWQNYSGQWKVRASQLTPIVRD